MHIYTSYNNKRATPKTVRRGIGFVIPIVLLISIIFLIQKATQPTVISPITAHAAEKVSPPRALVLKKKDPEEFKSVVTQALDDSIPEYSIVVDDFLTNFHGELGEQIPYTAASVNKLPILIYLYNEIQKGKLTEEKKIVFNEEDRQDYGTGTMRYQDAGGSYSIKDLASLMIKQSDNTAAYIIAEKILNIQDIQIAVNSWGLRDTNMTQNVTTNADMDLLLRKLFTGQLLNANLTREVIDLLADSDYEDRLPALLPQDTRVYHKIGTAIGDLHDVGVVMDGKTMYYIGIFTNGVSDDDQATKTIARVSKAVYDFMAKDQ